MSRSPLLGLGLIKDGDEIPSAPPRALVACLVVSGAIRGLCYRKIAANVVSLTVLTLATPATAFALLTAGSNVYARRKGIRATSPLAETALVGVLAAAAASLEAQGPLQLSAGAYDIVTTYAAAFALLAGEGQIDTAAPISFFLGTLLIPLSASLKSFCLVLLVPLLSAAFLVVAQRTLARHSLDALSLVTRMSPIACVASLIGLCVQQYLRTRESGHFPQRHPPHELLLLIGAVLCSAIEFYAAIELLARTASAPSVAVLSFPKALVVTMVAGAGSSRTEPQRMHLVHATALAGAMAMLMRSVEEPEQTDARRPPTTKRRLLLACAFLPLLIVMAGSRSWTRRALDRFASSSPNELAVGRLPPSSRSTVDIVVAYYDEEIDGLNQQLDEILAVPAVRSSRSRVIIYSKGAVSIDELERSVPRADEIVALPNVGREGHTYLEHIVRHYDQGLADHTAFLQGHLTWVGLANDRLRLFRPETGYLHFAPYSATVRGKDLTNDFDFPAIRDIYVLFAESLMPPTNITIAWAAQFIVSRDRILARSKSKYESMRDMMNPSEDSWIATAEPGWGWDGQWSAANPWLGHSLERSWPIIMGCNGIDESCPDVTVNLEKCQCFDEL